MRVDDFLSTGGYVIINKKLLKAMGINKACFLMELVSQRRRFEKKTKSKFFFITQKNIFDYIGINKRTQIRYIKEFEDLGVIGVEKRGMPQRNWYTINDDVIIDIINRTGELEDDEENIHQLDIDEDIEDIEDIEGIEYTDTKKDNKQNPNKEKEEEDNNTNLFEEFREKYPRKVNKKKAETSFKKLSEKDKRLAIDMIEKFKQTKQWQDKQYIPHPTTYLNGERFKDEIADYLVKGNEDCPITTGDTLEIAVDEHIKRKFDKLWSEYPAHRRTNEEDARQIFYAMTNEEQDTSIKVLAYYKKSPKRNEDSGRYVVGICRYLKEKMYNVDPEEDTYHFSDPNSRWFRDKYGFITEKYNLSH